MRGLAAFLRRARFSSASASTTLAALAFSLALAGCFGDERVAGGDDIPNSVEPLGKRTAEARRDSSDWNAHGEAPQSAPGVYDSARVPESAPQSGSAKSGASASAGAISGAAGAQLLTLDAEIGFELPGTERLLNVITEPVTGLLRVVRVQSLPALAGQAAFRAEDTTWYKADSAGPRLVRVSGFVQTQGETRYAVFEDGDGDGLLSPRAAGSLARVRFTTVRASGERETRAMTWRAGDDKDFNRRGDNGLAALQRSIVSGLDTLLSLVLTDADGDGLVYNPFRDSNQVEVASRARAGGVHTTLVYRVAVFRDSARNYAHRYRRVTTSVAGTDSVFAFGRDSLPDFAPGDTGFARRVFLPASASDTVASTEGVFKVVLSAARDGSGNRLLEVNRKQVYRFGAFASFDYRLRPTAPVADGSFARAGAVRARAELASGGSITFDGEATATEIFGGVMDSEGRKGTVRYDLEGKVKSTGGF